MRLWTMLKAETTVEEVIRNFFIRQPVLRVEQSGTPSPERKE